MCGLRSRTSDMASSTTDAADGAATQLPLLAGLANLICRIGVRGRMGIRALAAALLAAIATPAVATAAQPLEPDANAIVAENALAGTTRWDLTPPAKPAIEGYASESSAGPGQ